MAQPCIGPYLVALGYFIGNCHLPIAKLWVVRSWHGHKKQPFPASRPSICSNNFANSSTIKIDPSSFNMRPPLTAVKPRQFSFALPANHLCGTAVRNSGRETMAGARSHATGKRAFCLWRPFWKLSRRSNM